MPPDAPIDPALRIGAVRLAVGDLSRSSDFYERVLGLPLISLDENGALLGVDRERPALILGGLQNPAQASPRSTGLFHVAWLHPSRAALAETVRRVVQGRWRIDGAADHGVSEALYLSDPDGLGIEIYVDRPRDQWKHRADGRGVEMVTLPLDLEDLLAQAPAGFEPEIAAGTAIGHVHLKVSDVPRAVAFYSGVLGLQEQARLPSAAFLSAGGYHHHVGLNSWQSSGEGPPPQNAPGLRLIGFELGGKDALSSLERRLAEPLGESGFARGQDGRISLRDPDGQLLCFGHR
ncbi:MAG: VOC family protein [Solirubrobacteraceae bacterium]|jgi:catechol 2,3-dioxygenase